MTQLVSIGEVADVLAGNAWKSSAFSKSPNGLPIIRIQNVTDGESGFVYWPDKYDSKYVIEDGDMLLSLSGNVKLCEWKQGKALLNQRVVKLVPSEKLEKRYFYWAVSRAVADIEQLAKHAVIANVSITDLKEFQIPLPPLEEQKRIATILDKADAIRRKRQQAIALADQLLRSVFLDMIGDPVTNPKGWEVAPLSSIVSALEGGKNVNPDESVKLTLNRVLKVSAVTSGIFLPEESKPLPDNFEPPESYFVRKGDLLISRANTSELIGATAFVHETPGNIVLPDKIWRFIWKDEKNIHPLYVHYLFRQSYIRREISIRSSGTSGSMKNIPKPKLLEIFVPIPPVSEQNKFGTIVEKVINTHGKFAISHREIAILFNSLTQRAFRGELSQVA